MSNNYQIGKHLWDVSTTPIIAIGSVKLQLKFLLIETPPNPLPKFVIDPNNIPPLTTFVLGTTTISNHVVVMITLGDLVTSIPTCCLQNLVIVAFDTLGEAKLT
jgi:hypothetical protein